MINIHYSIKDNFELMYDENETGGAMPSLHTHSHYEIYYLNEGERSYIINNKVYDMTKGSVALIPPNTFHKTSGGRFSRTLISFSSQYLNGFFRDSATKNLLACFSSPIVTLSEDEQRTVESILLAMSKNEDDCSYDKRLLLLAELLTIFNTHSEKKENPPKTISNTLLSHILDYISTNYLDIKTLDEIAHKFFITKYHLCRLFKENTGMSIFQYINLMKLHSACNLLSTTNNSITDISLECGFNSHAYFCKTFSNQFGISPMAYRKKQANSTFL